MSMKQVLHHHLRCHLLIKVHTKLQGRVQEGTEEVGHLT